MPNSFTLKSKRFEELRKRKNFLPSLIITLVLWLALAAIVYLVPPLSSLSLIIFFIMVFTTILFTFSLLLTNKRRGFWVAISVTLFLFLRYLGVGNIINLVLLIGIPVTFEFYFTRRS